MVLVGAGNGTSKHSFADSVSPIRTNEILKCNAPADFSRCYLTAVTQPPLSLHRFSSPNMTTAVSILES